MLITNKKQEFTSWAHTRMKTGKDPVLTIQWLHRHKYEVTEALCASIKKL